MTAFSPYQPYPGPAPVLAAPPPIFVAVSEPARQRRVTVAFRILLAVPHLFLLYWISLAAGIIVFIGWWGALFTGRLPQFAVEFVSGFLRWTTRVYAYDYLLTDVYPPFTLDDDPAYPVRVAIPEPQRLNRAAVFFRFVLIFPANVLAAIVILGGGTLLGFIAWLVTLVTGQLPASFHLAYVALLRFQTRFFGYWWLLTPAYPGGLYGDKPGAVSWADATATGAQAPGLGTVQGYGTPQGYGAPQGGYEPTQGYGAPQAYGAPEAYGAPQGYGAPVPAYGAPGGYSVRPAFQPATWLLALTSGARKLMTTFIVLGSLFLVAYVALYSVIVGSAVSTTVDSVTAIRQLESSHTALSNSLDAWEQATTDCDHNLACVTKQDGNAASAFNTFSSELATTSVPAGAAADKARLSATAVAAALDFTRLSKATSDSQYQSTFSSEGLQQTLDDFDQNFTALITNLQSP